MCSLLLLVFFIMTQRASTLSSLEEMRQLAKACNQFSFEMGSIIFKIDQNTVFSSYSICTSLGILLLGARGNTSRELNTVLHFDNFEDPIAVGEIFQTVIETYVDIPDTPYLLTVVNGIFGQEKLVLEESFLRNLKKYFKTELKLIDFSQGESETIINDWIAEKTKNGLPWVFLKGSLETDSHLVLANTIYFKGNWEEVFNVSQSRKTLFTSSSGKKKEVTMMFTFGRFLYLRDEDLKASVLRLIFKGYRLSIVFILPDEVMGLSEVLSKLTEEKLKFLTENLVKTKVSVMLPRLSLTKAYDLEDVFKQLGTNTLFTETANFSGISSLPLRVSHMRHKIKFNLNEEGGEIAEATDIRLIPRAFHGTSEKFYADHPFYFAVVGNSTGFITLSGIITDPSND